MSLPPSYSSTAEYFVDSFNFLRDHRWIFTTSNTQFVKSNILDEIPKLWISHLENLSVEELNRLPEEMSIKDEWPDDLKSFFVRLKSLKPDFPNIQNTNKRLRKLPIKGISPKKLHEIENLSEKIYETSKDSGLNTFVDIGCGLGYLTQILNTNYNYNIFGIESDVDRVQSAQKRQAKYFPNSVGKVTFVDHFVGEDSENFISSKLSHVNRVGLVGMHACADLTISGLKLFCRMDIIEKIMIMPCCYHKMKMDGDKFENIPLSECLRSVLNKLDCLDLINRPFLRLASQQTAARWRNQSEEEHRKHGQDMFERSLIDATLNEGESISKIRTTSITENKIFKFENVCHQYNLINSKQELLVWSDDCHGARFRNLTAQYFNGSQLAEILTLFQTCIQLICENLVLLDKVAYIEEYSRDGGSSEIKFRVEKIVSDILSPRCFVYIGEKI